MLCKKRGYREGDEPQQPQPPDERRQECIGTDDTPDAMDTVRDPLTTGNNGHPACSLSMISLPKREVPVVLSLPFTQIVRTARSLVCVRVAWVVDVPEGTAAFVQSKRVT